jgi:hypothetical protein
MKKDQDRKREDDELARARELLARTVRFLSKCAADPESALRSEDPKELIRGLEALTVVPLDTPAAEDLPEPRTIHIRRRKSA